MPLDQTGRMHEGISHCTKYLFQSQLSHLEARWLCAWTVSSHPAAQSRVQVSGNRLRSVTSGAARSLTWPVAAAPGQGRAGVNVTPCWSALPGGLEDLPNGTGYLSVGN